MKTEIEKEPVKLVGADELARMLSVSSRHIWRLRAACKIPRPVSIGSCVRWIEDDIKTWIRWGCPSHKQFEARKAAQRKRT